MIFNDKEITESNKMMYMQYFIYLQEFINSKPDIEEKDIYIKYLNRTISSIVYIEHVKDVIEGLLNNKKYSRVHIDYSILSQCLNDDVLSFEVFIRKSIRESIIKELL